MHCSALRRPHLDRPGQLPADLGLDPNPWARAEAPAGPSVRHRRGAAWLGPAAGHLHALNIGPTSPRVPPPSARSGC